MKDINGDITLTFGDKSDYYWLFSAKIETISGKEEVEKLYPEEIKEYVGDKKTERDVFLIADFKTETDR